MTPFGTSFLLTVLAVQSPAADSLRLLALRLPESALVLEAKARPVAVREAVAGALALNELEAARKLAAAHAVAWRDSFLIREVARFATWTPAHRAGKVWADSVRRAGISVYSRDGAVAAIAVWRRALARATATGDTAGMAAVLGNIGAGLLEESELDSAESYLERSRALAMRVGDLRVQANAIGLLASASDARGEIVRAREQYSQAVTLRERIGDTRGLAADRNNLGLLAQTAGDLDEARRQFEIALAINRREDHDEVAATNLVNLAGLASLDGEFARAESLYRDALATWRARQQWADAADALHGLGQLELRRGDYPAAQGALREALATYERNGSLVEALAVRRELAGAFAAQGELQSALDALRRGEQMADSAQVEPGVSAGIALARADLAVQLNAFAEAERLYGRAEALFREAGDEGGQAEAREGRGFLLLERENHARAQPLLEAALRTQLAAGDRRAGALTRVSLGRLARARGDTPGARAHLARASADLDSVGDRVAAAAALGERAALEASAGLHAAARSLYREALARLGDRVAPDVAWQLHTGLALVLRAQGAQDLAATELRAALQELERPSQSLVLAERRSGFLADKWDAYAQLALVERDRGRPGAAFDASERLRAREMLELLSRGRVAPPDTAPELIRREQDLRRRIAELTRELESAVVGSEGLRGPDVSFVGGGTREALLRVQESYAELLLEMRERAPRHAALVSHEGVSWRDVAQRLAPGEALIEYLVSDSGSLAFVVLPDTIGVVELGLGRRDLARLVEFARGTLDPGRRQSTDSLWRGPLRRLHAHLLSPIEETGLLGGKTRLIVVPHGELHYLPFAALLEPDGRDRRGRFLIERYDVTVTPSATVWLTLGRRPSARPGGGLIAFAPKTGVLPATRDEVAAIARLAGDARVLTGGAATEQAFRREASRGRVLHLATYGVLNKQNPLFSYVELSPGGGHDGRLEVREVFGLGLTADLVVLSACQTGLGSGTLADVPPGDDWVSLTRAFLHAGAAHVVATLWPVEDQATAALMEQFYVELASHADPVRALAAAQRRLLAAGATAHPFFWAGFVSVGSAERRGP